MRRRRREQRPMYRLVDDDEAPAGDQGQPATEAWDEPRAEDAHETASAAARGRPSTGNAGDRAAAQRPRAAAAAALVALGGVGALAVTIVSRGVHGENRPIHARPGAATEPALPGVRPTLRSADRGRPMRRPRVRPSNGSRRWSPPRPVRVWVGRGPAVSDASPAYAGVSPAAAVASAGSEFGFER